MQQQAIKTHHMHMGVHSKITLSEERNLIKLYASDRYKELYRLFHITIFPNLDYKDSEQF